VSSRPGATSAGRAAEALVAALRDPQTPLVAIKPLAEALAAVGGRLTPAEAASHAQQAVAVLDSLWAARTSPIDRAFLAQALAAVWARLDPAEATAHARRVAADLEEAFRDANPAFFEHPCLVGALAAVYAHLPAAEKVARATAVADALVVALRRPRNGLTTVAIHSEELATLCVHLDRAGAVRVADTLLTVLGDPEVRRYRLEFGEKMFKKVAARLDEQDLQRLLDHPLAAGRLQRHILDVLAGAKNRRFRNAWDYLDWADRQGRVHRPEPLRRRD
jgi:hypothetical protein